MQKRNLGNTGLEVSVIGLGGIPIQRFNQDIANEVIDECVKQGVNFIDSARGYGASEELLGNALIGRRDQFYLATKSPAKTKEAMAEEIEKSLKAFQTDYIDVYQCHFIKDLEQLSMITGEGGAYEALLEAKKAGKIGHIGATAHNKDVLLKAIESGLWETIQFPYNFVEIQGLDLFKRAHELGIGILVMKPLAGGAIENVNLSLQFILNNDHITVTIPGMESKEQVIQNAAAGKDIRPLTAEQIEFIDSFRVKMGNNFCRRCGYCGPCPEGIDIPSMFSLDAYLTRYDLKDWAISRYMALPVTAGSCTKCGACEPKCPYDLEIRSMLEEVAARFGK
ncbi:MULTISPECIES: aldo/keto reductase [unclassified Fusibacter]|uniref:aldo/keto reductase n=1 Tax=unclassified Fusibacter TaxID=2624464 RepID=UPI001011C4B3|nr:MULTISPECIES: aldo/keto reductase [unclassified Fusibacter]MCK8061049.1 aldo/keto reductase [Fusibacter sp. A2]NPE20497.1 aldo/keto reductase [Fusibacter sp. A1]RXV63697.1 aldo/keto reductase [Fusibacter sp. A1]